MSWLYKSISRGQFWLDLKDGRRIKCTGYFDGSGNMIVDYVHDLDLFSELAQRLLGPQKFRHTVRWDDNGLPIYQET